MRGTPYYTMSLLEKRIAGKLYLYLQYRDEDGRNRTLYIGSPDDPLAKDKGKALWGAYQMALIEDRFKKWVFRREDLEWSIRSDWLERARDAKLSGKDRERVVTLAYGILDTFHNDICRHQSQKEAKICPANQAARILQPYVEKY